MVFKEHLFVIQHAEDFNLAGFVGHRIADALAKAITLCFCLVHDLNALCKRHLKLRFHMGYRPALEDVIGNHAIADQGIKEICKRIRIVVDTAQKDCLVIDNDASFQKRINRSDRLRRQLLCMVKLCCNIDRLFLPILL